MMRFKKPLSILRMSLAPPPGRVLFFLLLAAVARPCSGQEPPEHAHQATIALERTKAQEASFLAPRSLDRAQKAYDQYVRILQQGKPEKDVQKASDALRAALEQVEDQLQKTASILAQPLDARRAAHDVKAPTLAPKEYAAAESRMSEAIAKLEEGKTVEADRIGREAIPLYQAARRSAVKVDLLGVTQTLLIEARNRKADLYAPASYRRAQALLNEVTVSLDQESTVSPILQQRAREAEYEMRHALRLAAKIDTLQKKDAILEQLLLAQEAHVARVADVAGLQPDFLSGVDEVLAASLAAITARQDSLTRELAHQDTAIRSMQTTIDSLKNAFSQQQIRIASMIEEYQQDLQTRKEELEQRRRELETDLKSKMQIDLATQAQTRFSAREAAVLREQKTIIIRLLGIEFPAGKSALSPEHYALLDKLGGLLALYPRSTVLVEGHTDATGTEAKNVELSEARATSVREYLVNKAGLRPEQVAAKGFGSARPIESNDTPKGREQNRRIDVVVSF